MHTEYLKQFLKWVQYSPSKSLPLSIILNIISISIVWYMYFCYVSILLSISTDKSYLKDNNLNKTYFKT